MVNYCLEYDGKSKRSYLHGYSDSSYAEDLDTQCSVSGNMFLLGRAAISWSSKLQRTVSLSLTEAEYVEVSEAARQALWFRNLIQELGDPIKEPITLFGDNHASIFLTEEPKHNCRIKHVDVKWHFVREHIEQQDVVLYYHYITHSIFTAVKCSKNCRKLSSFSSLFEYTKFCKNFNIVLRFLQKKNFRKNLKQNRTFNQDFIQSFSSHKIQC
jgi:hypothetical protein